MLKNCGEKKQHCIHQKSMVTQYDITLLNTHQQADTVLHYKDYVSIYLKILASVVLSLLHSLKDSKVV